MKSDIINVATKEIGYVEDANNSTKYGVWFGLDGVAWCGIFVSWCYAKANHQLPKIGWLKGFAGCQMMFEYAKKNDKLTNTPEPGDIVLFDWNRDGRHDHTGIFIKWVTKGKTFETIEGNTSIINQSNGGSVMRRTRNVKVARFVKMV